MDQPTLAEEVRALRGDVQRLVDAQQQYVTKEILALKLEALAKDHADLEAAQQKDRERIATMGRWLWSGIVAPVIVGLILWLLLGKAP